ncbi:hypothetical protein [Bacillus toyonensis]|uniref:hypothetical protein n=1 Tax=Bacillus toyonensis TaxID=155322 RepID=UPI001596CCCB|nr:hypothetical protein [Bacillus toyonensis]
MRYLLAFIMVMVITLTAFFFIFGGITGGDVFLVAVLAIFSICVHARGEKR